MSSMKILFLAAILFLAFERGRVISSILQTELEQDSGLDLNRAVETLDEGLVRDGQDVGEQGEDDSGQIDDRNDSGDEDETEGEGIDQQSSRTDDGLDKRGKPIRCWCWIGWEFKKSRKYFNFGVIRRFKIFARKKQSRCSKSCAKRCAEKWKYKKTLCKRIGKTYHKNQDKVGCFSQLRKWDTKNNIWDFDGWPTNLCCKKIYRKCSTTYGAGWSYHNKLMRCVKFKKNGCPPVNKPGLDFLLCCYGNKLYNCRSRLHDVKSVKCW